MTFSLLDLARKNQLSILTTYNRKFLTTPDVRNNQKAGGQTIIHKSWGPVLSHQDLISPHKIALFFAEFYRDFEPLHILLGGHRYLFPPKNHKQPQMLVFLRDRNLIPRGADHTFDALDQDARAFFTGRWLEKYAYLTPLAAGYEEVDTGRVLKWRAGPYERFHELYLLTRKEHPLLLLSCKAISIPPQTG